jgi:LysR family transcriptional regulator (chromosome initiation inhibitor)
VRDHLRAGRLVELVSDTPLDVAIDWQINRFAADKLVGLTRQIAAVARGRLIPP